MGKRTASYQMKTILDNLFNSCTTNKIKDGKSFENWISSDFEFYKLNNWYVHRKITDS